jgi:hypothetical protein
MARNVSCPNCQSRVSVPDAFNRDRIPCPNCRAVIDLLQDVSGADTAGNDANAGDAAFTCATCGGSFPVESVYDQQGVVICHGCFAQAEAAAAAAAEAAQGAATTTTDTAGDFADPWAEVTAPAAAAATPAARRSGVPTTFRSGAAGAAATATATTTNDSGSTSTSRRPPPPKSKTPFLIAGIAAAAIVGVVIAVVMNRPDPKPPAKQVAQKPVVKEPAPVYLPKVSGGGSKLFGEIPAPPDDGQNTPVKATPRTTVKPPVQPAVKPKDPAEPPTVAVAKPPKVKPPKEKPPVKPKVEPKEVTEPTEVTERPETKPDTEEALRLINEAESLAKGEHKIDALAKYDAATKMLSRGSASARDDDVKKLLARATGGRRELLKGMSQSAEAQKMTAGALLGQGLRALADAKWKAGLESLADAKQIIEESVKSPADRAKDEQYVTALHGMVVAYVRTNQMPKAGAMFDDATVLGKTLKSTPTRELVWNRAVIDLSQNFREMRAVTGLKSYLEERSGSGPVDEEMLNLYGTAIAEVMADPPPNQTALKKAIAFYEQENKRLEATRPGDMHWGIQWVGGAERQRLEREKARTQEIYDRERERLNDISGRLRVAKKGRKVRVSRFRTKVVIDHELVNRLSADYKEQKERTDTASAAIPRPQWLSGYDLKVPTMDMEPTTVIASADRPPPTVPGPYRPTGLDPPDEPEEDSEPDERDEPDEPDMRPEPVEPDRPAPPSRATFIRRYAAAFPVGPTHLVTAAEPLGGATEVMAEDPDGVPLRARVVSKQGALALLEVDAADLGGPMRYMNLAANFGGGPVRCAGIPIPTIFGYSVALLDGTGPAQQPQGPWQVSLTRHPRLPGAPVLNTSGQVVGVAVPQRDDPTTKLPAVALGELRDFLRGANALPAAPSVGSDPSGVFHVMVDE